MAATLSIIALVIFGEMIAQAQSSAKIDQFGTVNAEDAMARLDRFALELHSHPESRGIIVASNTLRRDVLRGTFLRRAYGYRDYVVKSRGVEASRVTVVEGERKRAIVFELWTLPSNELSPISEEANAAEPPAPELFDSISIGPEAQCVGQLPIELSKLEDGLRILSDVLVHHSRAKAWIVAHPRTGQSQISTQAIIDKSRLLLGRNGIKPGRILSAVGSPRTSACTQVKIWIVPSKSTAADEAGYYLQLISEAESTKYTVRRLEFNGNVHISDNALRKQLVQHEGDVLSRQLLDQSLRNLSSLGSLYPVHFDDVEARLDREEKLIDLTVYFRERRRR